MANINIKGPVMMPDSGEVAYRINIPMGTSMPGPGRCGPPGKSAYQIACDNGFVGSEKEWLESLRGPEGLHGHIGPKGPKGDPGSGVRIDGFVDTPKELPFDARLGTTFLIDYKYLYVHVGYKKGDEDTPNWSWHNAGPLQGVKGDQGIQGAVGSQGIQGTQGFQGLQGTNGTQGFPGLQGSVGLQGQQGLQGNQGLQGSVGIQGLQGIQGIQGLQGLVGEQGIPGVGITGAQGIQGPQGFQGNQGNTGERGIQGPAGTNGKDGIPGAQGVQGLQGIRGLIGDTGLSAYEIALRKGYEGSESDWIKSLQGTQGIRGERGPAGDSNVSIATATRTGVVKPGDSLTINALGTLEINNSTINITTDQVKLASDITIGNAIGGFIQDEIVKKGTTLTNFLMKLTSAVVHPNYQLPTAVFSISDKLSGRIGDEVTLHFNIKYTKNDGGDIDRIDYLIDGVVVATGKSSMTYDYLITEGTHDIVAKVYYNQGPIKANSSGVDDPIGRIEAGVIETNSIQFTGSQVSYAGGSVEVPSDIDYTYLNTLSNRISAFESGVEYTFTVDSGAMFICVAVPSSVGKLATLVQSSMNMPVLDAFTLKEEQLINTDSGSELYNIYTLELAAPFNKDSFKFTIE